MAPKKKKKTTTAKKAVDTRPTDLTVNRPGWLSNTWLVSVLLALFGALLYVNTLGHDFAQDDTLVITENMFTTEGVSGWPGIFQYDTFYGYFKDPSKARLVSGGRYRPLSLALFALEYQLSGGSPAVMHFFNALWYGLTVFVLYWLLLTLMKTRASELKRETETIYIYFIPLAAALLFAAHPLHTEAVANIKGRDEILTLLGSLGALWLALLAYRRQNLPMGLAAGLLFFLALLSKENAITFLAVAPLTFYFFTKANWGAVMRYCAPLLAGAIIFLFIRGGILGWRLGEESLELMNNPFLKLEGGRWVAFTAGEHLATITYTLGKYLQLLFVPYPLTHDYYPRHVDVMTWGDWRVWLSFLAYAGLVIYAVLGLRRRYLVAYGIWFYLITLSIVSNIVFPVGTNMSERFLFMPSVGFGIAVAALLARWLRPGQRLAWTPSLAVLAVPVLAFSLLTVLRNPVWRDNFTLFTTDIQTSPNSAKLRNAMGGVLVDQWLSLPAQDREQRKELLTEAVGHLNEAIRIHPSYKNAYLLLGNAYNYLQDYEKSLAAYDKALEIDPGYQEALNNRNITYRDAGRYFGEQRNDLNTALQYLERAYAAMPEDYETVRLLGVAYGIGGRSQQAIDFFAKAAGLAPDNAQAWYNLATAYAQTGRMTEAEQYFQKARELNPNIEQEMRQGTVGSGQ